MLSILDTIACSLSYDHFVTRILCYFKVPVYKLTFKLIKPISDQIVYSLGFAWKDGTWLKTKSDRATLFAPSYYRLLTNVYPPKELPDFSLPLQSQRCASDV